FVRSRIVKIELWDHVQWDEVWTVVKIEHGLVEKRSVVTNPFFNLVRIESVILVLDSVLGVATSTKCLADGDELGLRPFTNTRDKHGNVAFNLTILEKSEANGSVVRVALELSTRGNVRL